MPSTITSFVTFVAGEKAKAGEVNTNFSNFRGDRVPINSDTQTASNNAHDLGVSSHRWKDINAATINLLGSTSTTDFSIIPSTSNTAGAFDMRLGTQTIASFTPTAINFALPGGSSAVSFDSQGMARNIVKRVGQTTGNFITSTNIALTNVTYISSGLSITLAALSESSFFVSFLGASPNTTSTREAGIAIVGAGAGLDDPVTAAIFRGASVLQDFVLNGLSQAVHSVTFPFAFDTPNTSGNITYSLQLLQRVAGASVTVGVRGLALRVTRI